MADENASSPTSLPVHKRFNPNTPNSAASPSVRRPIKKTRVLNDLGDQNLDMTAMPLDESQQTMWDQIVCEPAESTEIVLSGRGLGIPLNFSEKLCSVPTRSTNVADTNLEESAWNITLDPRTNPCEEEQTGNSAASSPYSNVEVIQGKREEADETLNIEDVEPNSTLPIHETDDASCVSEEISTVVSRRVKYAAYNDSQVSFLEMEARMGSESVDQLLVENNKLKEELIAAHNQNTRLRNELSSNKSGEAIKEIHQMKKDLEQLQETLKKQELEAVATNENLFMEQHKLAKMEREKEKNEMIIQNLRDELEEASRMCHTIEKDSETNDKLQKQVQRNVQLELELQILNDDILSLNEKVREMELQQERESAERELLMEKKMSEMVLEKEQKAVSEVRIELEQKIKELMAKLAEKENILAESQTAFNTELSTLREQLKDKDNVISGRESDLQVELSQLKNIMIEKGRNYENEFSSLNTEIERLKEELRQSTEMSTSMVANLKQEIEDAKTEKSEMEKDLLSSIEQLTHKIAAKEQEIIELEEKKIQLEMTIESAENESQSRNSLEMELAELREKIAEKEIVAKQREKELDDELISLDVRLRDKAAKEIEYLSKIEALETELEVAVEVFKKKNIDIAANEQNFRQERETFQTQLIEMKNKVQEMVEAAEKKSSEMKNITVKLTDSESVRSSLIIQLDEITTKLGEHEQSAAQSEAEVVVLKEKISETELAIQKMSEENRRLQGLVDSANLSIKEMSESIETEREKVVDVMTQLADSEAARTSLNVQLDEITIKLEERERATAQHETEIETEIIILKEKLSETEFAMHKTSEENKRLQDLLDSTNLLVREKSEAIETEREKMVDVVTQLADSEAARTSMNVQLDEITIKLAKCEAVLAQRESEDEVILLKQKLSETELTMQESRQMAEENRRLQGLLDSANLLIKEKTEAIEAAKDERASFEVEKNQAVQQYLQAFSLNEKILLKLDALEATAAANVKTLLEEFNVLQKKAKDSTDEKVMELEQRIASLQQEKASFENEIKVLCRTKEEAAITHSKMEIQISTMQEERARCEHEIQHILEEKDRKITEMQFILETLEHDKDELENKISLLEAALVDVNSEKEKISGVVNQLTSDIDLMRAERDQVFGNFGLIDNAQLSTLQSQIAELEAENNKLSIAGIAKEEEVQKLMIEVQKLRYDSDGLDMHHEVRRLKAEVERLYSECDEFDEIEAKLMAKIDDYEKKLGINQQLQPKGPALLDAITEGVQPLSPERCDVPDTAIEFHTPSKENVLENQQEVTPVKTHVDFNNTTDVAPNTQAVTPHANRTLGANMNHTTLLEPAGGLSTSVANKSLSESKRCAQQ